MENVDNKASASKPGVPQPQLQREFVAVEDPINLPLEYREIAGTPGDKFLEDIIVAWEEEQQIQPGQTGVGHGTQK